MKLTRVTQLMRRHGRVRTPRPQPPLRRADDMAVAPARRLRPRSVRSTWIAAVAMFVAIMVVTGAGTLVFTRHQANESAATTAMFGDELSALARLQKEVLDASIPMGGVLYELSRDGGPEEQWAEWQVHVGAVNAYFKTLSERTDRQHIEVDEARAEWNQVLDGVAEAKAMWGTGEIGAALAAGDDPFSTTVWAPFKSLQARLASLSVASVDHLRVQSDADARRQTQLEAAFAGALAIMLLLAALCASWLSNRVIRPLVHLRGAVTRFQRGELTGPIELPDAAVVEVVELGDAMTEMAAALSTSQVSLRNQAYTDGLTGLVNRRGFCEAAGQAFGAPGGDHPAVLLIDVDDFKYVNDSMGHTAGDELLRIVAGRLLAQARTNDTVARIGGDEFAILIDANDALGAAARVAERVLSSLQDETVIDGRRLHIGCSIGIAGGESVASAEDLVARADAAMYVAKGRGKQRYETFDPSLHATMAAHADLKNDLRSAAEGDQLELHYQPIVDLDSSEVLGMEALVRWNHHERGLLMPGAFIDVAEETGDIVAIGTWVIDRACRDLARYQALSERGRSLWMTVNVSTRQLVSGDVVSVIRDALNRHGIDPSALIVEITEASLLTDSERAVEVLDQLRDDGVRVAIDDFGTGFSSLQYLKRLPVDVIKIDRSFVADSIAGTQGGVILESIVNLGQGLGLALIAEGIERTSEMDRLRELGSMAGQGYLIARPMPADNAIELFASARSAAQAGATPAVVG